MDPAAAQERGLTLRLTVDTEAWRAHVAHVAAGYDPLVPVVKGNGYGFGRSVLARVADDLVARLGGPEPPTIAVGTVHELAGLPSRIRPLVLTPLDRSAVPRLRAVAGKPVLTVGDRAHVAALNGWRGEVVIKLASSMRRFGVLPSQLEGLERDVHTAGLTAIGYGIHLPLAGEDADRVAEVERWLAVLERHHRAPAELWVSHLGPDAHAALRERWPGWRFPMRLGTRLWHGDKSTLHLGADVIDLHPVPGGSHAGYRATRVIADGTLVVIGAGTAQGVRALDDGRSPFHYQRRRLALLEPPHMHTSMAFVPTGDACPAIGEVVDVQRPLISVTVDDLVWKE